MVVTRVGIILTALCLISLLLTGCKGHSANNGETSSYNSSGVVAQTAPGVSAENSIDPDTAQTGGLETQGGIENLSANGTPGAAGASFGTNPYSPVGNASENASANANGAATQSRSDSTTAANQPSATTRVTHFPEDLGNWNNDWS